MARVTSRQVEVLRLMSEGKTWAPSMRSRSGGAFWRILEAKEWKPR